MSTDGSDPFVDAEEGTVTPRSYRTRSYVAGPRSASPQEARSRRGREVSPTPVLDRRARASRYITPAFKFLPINDS
jgi:hypothetical protein